MSPYDWQESISQRSQYVEARLKAGQPGFALSREEGVLMGSLRRQNSKIFEIYDSLAMMALGLQSDIEALRVASIEFCHKEGFQKSAEDVTLSRLAAGLSSSIKQSHSDLRRPPLVALALFAELGDAPRHDHFTLLEFDGDYVDSRQGVWLAGSSETKGKLEAGASFSELASLSLEECLSKTEERLRAQTKADGLVFEAALLDRRIKGERRFIRLAGKENGIGGQNHEE